MVGGGGGQKAPLKYMAFKPKRACHGEGLKIEPCLSDGEHIPCQVDPNVCREISFQLKLKAFENDLIFCNG